MSVCVGGVESVAEEEYMEHMFGEVQADPTHSCSDPPIYVSCQPHIRGTSNFNK